MTTYRRPAECTRALKSAQAQTYPSWRMLVVIDDPATDYTAVEAFAKEDTRFTLIKNANNIGKNASVNRAFMQLCKKGFSGYILFLDDDDWLSPDCLKDFSKLIKKHTAEHWFVTNRTDAKTGLALTTNETGRDSIAYLTECLVRRRFSGDATHCLDFSKIKTLLFPTTIRNAEEWLYFAHVASIIPRFIYANVTGTLSQGYSPEGLTDQYRMNAERNKNILPLIKEAAGRHLFNPLVWFYLGYRLLRRFV